MQLDTTNKPYDPTPELKQLLVSPAPAPCFALLLGINSTTQSPVSIPVNHVPSTLGRETQNDSSNTKEGFIGLGKASALSRNHAQILYIDANMNRFKCIGGNHDVWEFEKSKTLPELVYPIQSSRQSSSGGDNTNYHQQTTASDFFSAADDGLLKGSFAIEVIGKNPITVGRKKVSKGQIALLQSGTPIVIGPLHLYFLLPTDEPSQKITLKVPSPNSNSKCTNTNNTNNKRSAGSNTIHTTKRPRSTKPDTGDCQSTVASGKSTNKKAAELDYLPVSDLLLRMTDAINNNQWDRRHQMIGNAIALKAVKDAAKSDEIQEMLAKEGGVARMDIIKWIESSPVYSNWVSQILTKMEVVTFQTNIGKCLPKVFERIEGTFGKNIRWKLNGSMNISSNDSPPSAINDNNSGNQRVSSVASEHQGEEAADAAESFENISDENVDGEEEMNDEQSMAESGDDDDQKEESNNTEDADLTLNSEGDKE